MTPARAALEAAGGQLVVGFDGEAVPEDLRRFVAEAAPAGVVLFGRNVRSLAQTAALLRELRALWPTDGPAPLLAVDQEGGPVRRLKAPDCPEVLQLPAAAELASRGEPALTEEAGRVLGVELAAIGFNLDFAPVLDVDSNPANPIIGRRAFGKDARSVVEQALAFARGLGRAGILACGKHFPGHGDTAVDSHLTLPRLAHSLERLRAVELVPFAAAVAARLPALMTAHIVFEALDPVWPATLSPRVLPELLRGELGFDGVVFSDDLEMAAIAAHHDARAIAEQGRAATVDLFLACRDLERAAELRDALARLGPSADAGRRVLTLRRAAADHALEPAVSPLPERAAAAALARRLASA
ncbi:MAG: beta-N-acetylhexosaminidase [Deltaproteobacteria bacterium]|nr:beta-N-acetylhexosaminidase [Deltaproteobacteria bacterium]